jgi:hypothetical protein
MVESGVGDHWVTIAAGRGAWLLISHLPRDRLLHPPALLIPAQRFPPPNAVLEDAVEFADAAGRADKDRILSRNDLHRRVWLDA